MDNWWTIVMKIIMMIFWLKTFGLKTFAHKNIWLSFYTSCRSITLNYMFIYLFNEDLKMSWLHLIMLNFWEICSWSYILCIQKPLYMIYIVFSFTVSHGWSCSLGLNPFKVSFIDQNVLLFRLRLTTTGITKNWQRLRIL